MFSKFCSSFNQPIIASVTVLPLITLRHPIPLLNQGHSCQVCCQSDNSATLNFRYYDPLMENKITLHLSYNGLSLPFNYWKSRHSFGSMFHIYFSYPEFYPGFYELRIENRYGTTRVKFEVMNQPKTIGNEQINKLDCLNLLT